MKARSDTPPNSFVQTQGITHFNFNVKEVTELDEKGAERTVFEYEYVVIHGAITRSKLIEAVIRDSYSASDELALLHNKQINKDTAEYTKYQDRRTAIKAIVDNALTA